MARSFFATTDRITCGTLAMPNIFSFTAWIKKITKNADNVVFGIANRFIFNPLSTGALYMDCDMTGSLAGKWSVNSDAGGAHYINYETDTNWHHLAWTYDSTGANSPNFYVDGILYITDLFPNVARTQAIQASTAAIAIGNDPSSATISMGGSMAWVNFHNVVLNSTEINETMNLGTTSRGAMGQWSLQGSSLADASGNGHTGTAAGTTVVSDPPGVGPIATSTSRPRISSNSVMRSYT